ncbi:MAG: hypothetical protein KC777_13990, partial [Cyanobacteria bacterium HKST-UBA02]|nr:hypothetical protein [Cyanobacteria bacterium HKST-UBA02]
SAERLSELLERSRVSLFRKSKSRQRRLNEFSVKAAKLWHKRIDETRKGSNRQPCTDRRPSKKILRATD